MSEEYDMPICNRPFSKLAKQLPRLDLKLAESPYRYMPHESIRKFLSRFLSEDENALATGGSPVVTNEVKFFLYDMFISGLSPEMIVEKTDIELHAVKMVLSEAQLIDYAFKASKTKIRKREEYDHY